MPQLFTKNIIEHISDVHHLSTVVNADKIAVLEQGKTVVEGNYQLWQKQTPNLSILLIKVTKLYKTNDFKNELKKER